MLDALIAQGKTVAPHPVLIEIGKKSDDLHNWLKQRPAMFAPLPIQQRSRAILAKYPRLVGQLKHRTAADTFVIALAVERGLVVLTEENYHPNPNRPQIPTVCRDQEFSCECIKLLALTKREKWVIG